jgi:WD40 repeat protein/predicted Ser/Thr protein kinase
MALPSTAASQLSLLLAKLAANDLPGRLAVLREHQCRSWERGEHIAAEEYVAHLPSGADEDTLVLIWGEVQLRGHFGETPALAEYQSRFPRLAELLARQFELEGMLAQWDSSLTDALEQPADRAATFESPAGYHIIAERGRGGMGVVYKARQLSLNRIVALKMLWPGGAEAAERASRFHREAEVAARLQHPNIAQIYEFGDDDVVASGPTFIAMEFVDGPTLAETTRGVIQPPADAARIVETLAAAIHYAHEHGIVHRDLKPENVLISSEKVLKIVDFGLAKRLAADQSQTLSGQVFGTPTHMAPEQASGRQGEVGPPTDVWALGVILYELLAGRPPFRAETPIDTINQLIHEPPMPIRRLSPDVPRDLETVCLKCLEKDPSRRYRSAGLLADDLGRFRAGAAVSARPISVLERLGRWRRRNPALAAALALSMLLLVAIAVGATVAAFQLAHAVRQVETADRQRAERLFDSIVAEVRARRLAGDMGRRVETLKRIGEAASLAAELSKSPAELLELRNETVAALALIDLVEEHSWNVPRDAAGILVFNRELTDYAYLAQDGQIGICDQGASRARRRLAAPQPVNDDNLVRSNDGRYLVANLRGQGAAVAIWDLHSPAREPRLLPGKALGPQSISPDNQRIALLVKERIVLHRLSDLAPLEELAHPEKKAEWDYRASFDPTGNWLALVGIGAGGVLRILDWRQQKIMAELDGQGMYLELPGWYPDGRSLAVGWGRNIRIYGFEKEGSQLVSEFRGPQQVAVSTSYLAGPNLLLSSGWEGVTRVWDPRLERQLLEIPGTLVAASPRDRFVISNSGRVSVIRVEKPAEFRLLHHPPCAGVKDLGVSSVSFSKDGDVLAASGGGSIRFFPVRHGSDSGQTISLRDGNYETQARFISGADSLLLTGAVGAVTWPWERNGERRKLGQPHLLTTEASPESAVTPDGRVIAYSQGEYALVRSSHDPLQSHWVGPHGSIWSLTLSPDGSRLATGNWHGDDVIIWEVATNRILHRIPGKRMSPRFSPDGRRLVTREFDGDLTLWDTTDWRAIRSLRLRYGPVAFDPTGRCYAVGLGLGRVRLFDSQNAGGLVDLVAPLTFNSKCLAFDRNGGRLAVGTSESSVYMWDLHALRRRLAKMGLDWESSPLPEADQPEAIAALTIEPTVLAERPEALRAGEIDRITSRLADRPNDGLTHFRLGQLYLEGDRFDLAFRHLAAARAIVPQSHAVAREYFMAAYHTRRWREACEVGEHILRNRPAEPLLAGMLAAARGHLEKGSK